MRDTTDSMTSIGKGTRAGWKRAMWFVGLYGVSLVVFSAMVYMLRWLIL